jgi:hypothetical protein
VADRVVVISDGRILYAGPADETLADPRLVEAGVAEPAPVRLRRAAEAGGVDPARLVVPVDA